MKRIFLLGFTPCKTEQPLQGMKLKEKNCTKINAYRKSIKNEPQIKSVKSQIKGVKTSDKKYIKINAHMKSV